MSMSQLASHVAEMCGWFGSMMESMELDIPPDFKPFLATSRKQLLDKFDQNVASTRAALAAAGDQALMQDWSLKFSGDTMFTMPRIACYRTMIMNHVIHHRAQLSVYYRLNGVPVPGMYGPSADEAIPATAGH
jgi:uncharacterized damage-inducible protein DinB